MLFRVIDKQELPALVEGFMQSYEVIGPVRRGQSYVLDVISSPDQLALDHTMTTLPPKKYLLPRREPLIEFDSETNSVTSIPIDETPRVLFGLHACDINGINRLDQTFLEGAYDDPYYRARRSSTLIVGVSCTPQKECFCGLWGTGEAHQGYDLFLHDLGDSYLVSIYSVEGADMLEATTNPHVATEEETRIFQMKSKQFHDSFSHLPDVPELPMLMDALHKDPFWDELGERCLSCTACSASCPTCYCFNIVDTLDPDGKGGVRERVWDSCCSPEFALVAQGHNFRETPRNRVRHRFYHKLMAYMARNDTMLCVGCGRCVRYCKADINPLTVIEGLYRNRDTSLAEGEGEQ